MKTVPVFLPILNIVYYCILNTVLTSSCIDTVITNPNIKGKVISISMGDERDCFLDIFIYFSCIEKVRLTDKRSSVESTIYRKTASLFQLPCLLMTCMKSDKYNHNQTVTSEMNKLGINYVFFNH